MHLGEFTSFCFETLHLDPFATEDVRIQREEDLMERRAEGFRQHTDYEVFLLDGAMGVAESAAKELGLPVGALKHMPPDTPLPTQANLLAESFVSFTRNFAHAA